jgi:hypothetical protein
MKGWKGFGIGSCWEEFQLSENERSTQLTSVLRSEALKYKHVRMMEAQEASELAS